MKSLILMLGLVVSFSAQAKENFYRCVVTTQPKGASYGYELGMYLSNKRVSTHRVAQTELKLIVNELTNEITGTVNGQPNFKLSGNAIDGAMFESAYAVGAISCRSVELPVALYNTQHSEIYVAQDQESRLSLKYIEQLPKSCYISNDTEAVMHAISTGLQDRPLAISLGDNEINVTRDERTCLESRGSYDDYECIRWSKPAPKTYTLKNCYQSSQDPR